MPSNFTENYQLSQWSKGDRVKMEDFNADNAKLDAAVKEADQRLDAARRTDLLAVHQWTPGAKRLDISLTPFDLSRYVELEVRFSRLSASASLYLTIDLNGKTGCYQNEHNGSTLLSHVSSASLNQISSGLYTFGGALSIKLDCHYIVGLISYPSIGSSSCYFATTRWGTKSITPETLSSINFYSSSNPINSGTFYLIGYKY